MAVVLGDTVGSDLAGRDTQGKRRQASLAAPSLAFPTPPEPCLALPCLPLPWFEFPTPLLPCFPELMVGLDDLRASANLNILLFHKSLLLLVSPVHTHTVPLLPEPAAELKHEIKKLFLRGSLS